MHQCLDKVRQFHGVFNYEQADESAPESLTAQQVLLRTSFIYEELSETLSAMSEANEIEVLDGLTDICYFALGTLACMGEKLDSHAWSYVIPGRDDCTLSACLSAAVAEACTSMIRGDECVTALTNLAYLCKSIIVDVLRVDFYAAFDEVHESNMSKVGADGKPVMLSNGKIGKSDLYVKPNLRKVLNENALGAGELKFTEGDPSPAPLLDHFSTGQYKVVFYTSHGVRIRGKDLYCYSLDRARRTGRTYLENQEPGMAASFTVDRRVFNTLDVGDKYA